MSTPELTRDDPLDDFSRRMIVLEDTEKAVYVSGAGPAVVVMPEMPGISPQVARFSRWVRDAGFTVYMPSLFGRAGVMPPVGESIDIFRRACVSAEFQAAADGGASPAVHWLRLLARLAHAECGGPGVGAVGMCFTGNFALGMMLEGPTMAPVLCQPSLPLDDPSGTGLHERELSAIRARLDHEDLSVLGMRFEGDRWCAAQRFAAFSKALGPRFIGRVLPDSAANPEPPPFFRHVVASPHSVVTAHLIDEEGQPTIAARDEIIEFLKSRLLRAG